MSVLGAALGGGLTVKVLDILYTEWRRRSDQKQTVTEFVDTHLDPVLKTANDLVGKLRSLGENDFLELGDLNHDTDFLKNAELLGLLYLFARFWSRVEIFKLEGLTLTIPMDRRGHILNEFFKCLESRPIRLVSRTFQRAIAETAIDSLDPPIRTTPFTDFVPGKGDKAEVERWLIPLRTAVMRTSVKRSKKKNKKEKQDVQGLLQYYTILHALIDTLDPDHLVTNPRPGLPNKLSKQTRAYIEKDVFSRCLPFVTNHRKYLVPEDEWGPDIVVM